MSFVMWSGSCSSRDGRCISVTVNASVSDPSSSNSTVAVNNRDHNASRVIVPNTCS